MPLRIAFYDAFGLFEGSGRAMLDVIQRLDARRFEAVVVSPRDGDLIAAARARGLEAAVLEPPGALRRYNKALLSGGAAALPGIGLALARYGVRLRNWLRANRIGILHANQTRAALQAGLGAKRAGIPMVWVVRIQEPLPALATRFGGWCASAVVSLAPTSLDGFAGRPALRSKLVDIPLGVDTSRFAPADRTPPTPHGLHVEPGDRVVALVGGLHPRKRHDLLIEAAPRVLEHEPRARFLIVGGGFEDVGMEYEARLRQRTDELGLADRIVFVGRRDDVPAILRVCALFVLPSDQEGLPGSVLEAMATAKPCVVTPAAAAPVVDGATGLIVPRDDPEALAEAVLRVLLDRALADAMGRAGRERAVELYSLDATVRQYEALYERLAGAPSTASPAAASPS
jgi:glycosyltransferase involved in cell wall biosynthesis